MRKSLLALVLGLATVVGTASAQMLSMSYDVMPKAGMAAQFEAALKAHAEFRMAQKDPWSWTVLTYETGPDAGGYHIRSGGHSWADFDAYEANASFMAAAMTHWNTTVVPLVATMTATISRTDTAISSFPSDWDPINLINVTTYRVPPAQREQFFNHVKTAHAALKAGGFTGTYGWSYPVSGGEANSVTIAGFHKNWADMEDPTPSFRDIMMKSMGEKKMQTWMEGFLKTVGRTETVTLRMRRDLSVMPGM